MREWKAGARVHNKGAASARYTAPQSDYFNKMFVRIHNIRWIVVNAFNLDHNLAVW